MQFQRIASISMLVISLFASGCASQVAVLNGFQPADEKVNLTLVDLRPEKEKTTEFLSYSITNCDYGIRRLGDEMTVPSRLALLRSDLIRNLGAAVDGKEISVLHYTVHFNSAASLRGVVYGMNRGLIAGVMEPMGSNCPREKVSAGWYSAIERITPYSPLIVEITASIDGKQHAVRAVYAPSREYGGSFGDPAAAAELFVAIRKATDSLSESIKSGAGKT